MSKLFNLEIAKKNILNSCYFSEPGFFNSSATIGKHSVSSIEMRSSVTTSINDQNNTLHQPTFAFILQTADRTRLIAFFNKRRSSQHHRDKPFRILLKQWCPLGHTIVSCTSLQTNNHLLGLVFFHTKPRDLLRGMSLKWPILCRVGRKNTTQSINKIGLTHYLSNGHLNQPLKAIRIHATSLLLFTSQLLWTFVSLDKHWRILLQQGFTTRIPLLLGVGS